MNQSNIDRLHSFIVKGENADQCWGWIGGMRADGYGRFWMDGKDTSAHRAAYQLFIGEIPPGKMVRHSCDVPTCTNFRHLLLGTHAENMRDMVERKRVLIGEANGASKLKESQVLDIKARIKNGGKIRTIARLMSLPRSTVRNIAKGFAWKHLQAAL